MTVSQLAESAGTSADTVRYYDRIGLLGQVGRSDAGYRLFDGDHLRRLRFIRTAKRFGMSLEDVRELLSVRDRGLCPCGHAEETLTRRLEELQAEISALQQLRDDIGELLAHGAGDAARNTGDGCWTCGAEDLLQIRPRSEV